jgi:hypothetical protein
VLRRRLGRWRFLGDRDSKPENWHETPFPPANGQETLVWEL